MELTHTRDQDQTCAAVNMLKQLAGPLGFTLRQLVAKRVHDALPYGPGTSWRTAPSAWDTLSPFPSRVGMTIEHAYRHDFRSYSTNLVGYRNSSVRWLGPTSLGPEGIGTWPPLKCAVKRSWGNSSRPGIRQRPKGAIYSSLARRR